MRILFSIHLFPPHHLCGAERYVQSIIKHLQSKGHECRVLHHCANVYNIKTPYTYDGIQVYGKTGNIDQYAWADVLVTHLDYTHHTIMIGNIIKRPVVCLVHNTQPYNCIQSNKNLFVVYNAQHAREALNYDHPSMVLPPPCDYRKYDVGKNPIDNEYITLISLNHNKGGEVLYRLAEAMPDRKFLAVTGSYDAQIKRSAPNVRIIDKQEDMRQVYGQTRLLIMPSLYESWGMTATEAAANGIPVIACDTPGLRENLSYAGIFMPERSWKQKEPEYIENEYGIEPWIHAIEFLDDRNRYAEFSVLARERSRELDPVKSLDEFEQFIIKARYATKHKGLQLSGRFV